MNKKDAPSGAHPDKTKAVLSPELVRINGEVVVHTIPLGDVYVIDIDYCDTFKEKGVSLFGDYLDAYFENLVQLTYMTGASRDPEEFLSFTKKQLGAYLQSLLATRIAHVRGERAAFQKSNFEISIPVYWHYILSNIGNVDVREYHKRLVPSAIKAEMTKVEMMNISIKLKSIALNSTVQGFPRSNEGNEDFMLLTLVENQLKVSGQKETYTSTEIVGVTRSHEPPMVLASAFVRAKRAVDILSPVSYGSIEKYRHSPVELASIGFKN
jgi:hypothetical protein